MLCHGVQLVSLSPEAPVPEQSTCSYDTLRFCVRNYLPIGNSMNSYVQTVFLTRACVEKRVAIAVTAP